MEGLFYGASQEEWDAFISLAKKDIRPTVCDPTLKKLPTSTVDNPSKVPSIAASGDNAGYYYGVRNWVNKEVSDGDVANWRRKTAHGICLVGNLFKGFDLDIESEEEANAVQAYIESEIGKTPCRRRKFTSRRLLMFKLDSSDEIRKQVINTPNGVVELLANKQQFVVAGTHLNVKGATRYYWVDGLPKKQDIPIVSKEKLVTILNYISFTFGASKTSTMSLDLAPSLVISTRNIDQISKSDKELAFVLASPNFREVLPDGKIAVKCPFEELHRSTNGEFKGNITATVYLPKGLGGLHSSGFKCMHASHGEIHVTQFLNKINYFPEEFQDLTSRKTSDDVDLTVPLEVFDGDISEPSFHRVNRRGEVPSSSPNLCLAISNFKWLGIAVRFDAFTNRVEVAYAASKEKGWQSLTDVDYTLITVALMVKHNFTQPSTHTLRSAINTVAVQNTEDSAIQWINRLKWDGISRLEGFAERVLKTRSGEYEKAVVYYMWTALAGRILKPGCKADIAPVLIGAQGVMKSTFVASLVPEKSHWAGEINFNTTDDNNARLVQGKAVMELSELKGLNSRAEDGIKAWMSKVEDSWVPKYMEFTVNQPRRFLVIGTTNHTKFLSDTTGNRRWLPIHVGTDFRKLDLGYLKENRDQLWAEAAVLFTEHGVLWEAAELLSRDIVKSHVNDDAWEGIIRKWLNNQEIDAGNTKERYSVDEILCVALHMTPSSIGRSHCSRIERILTTLGWTEDSQTALWSRGVQ